MDKNTDRSNFETVIMSSDDFLEYFLERLDQWKAHDFISKRQVTYLKGSKRKPGGWRVLIIGDFSENYCFVDTAQPLH